MTKSETFAQHEWNFAHMAHVMAAGGVCSAADSMSDEPGHPWRTGTLLEGGYRIQRVLGRGGFAVVYEAVHPELGVVAIKVLDLASQDDTAGEARFVREAEMAARVKHPNVLQVHQLGRAPDGAPFLVMELLKGEDLSDLVDRETIEVPAAVEIGIQLCGALAEMAEAGVLHRDLKPHNVLMHREDGVIRPKLIDFGIATCTSGSMANARRLTRTGIVLGTPHYLSPEQARGDELDIRADLYSLGVLLYEAVCGRAPFEEGNLSALLASVLRDERPPITDFCPECPAGFAAILDKAIRRERDERFGSPVELADALARFATSEGLPRGDAALASLRIAARTTLPWELRTLARCDGSAETQSAELPPTRDVDAPPSNPPPALERSSERPPALEPARWRDPGPPTRRQWPTLVAAVAVAAGLPLFSLLVAGGSAGGSAEGPALPAKQAVSIAEASVDDASVEIAEPAAAPEGGTMAEAGTVAATEPVAAADTAAATEAGTTAEAEARIGAPGTAADATVAAREATAAKDRHRRPAPGASESRTDERRGPSRGPSARALGRQANRAYVRGRLAQSRALYARATRSDPSYADGWRGYGLVAAQMGRSTEARRALARYLRLAPRGPGAAAVRRTLASLR